MNHLKESLFLFNFDNETKKKIKGVCLCMGIRAKEIPPEQCDQPLGCLAGLPEFEPASDPEPAPSFSDPMAVLHRFTSKRMDEFLQHLKKAGVPKLPYKAVLTEENAGWVPGKLYEELVKEDQAMRDGTTAHPQETKK